MPFYLWGAIAYFLGSVPAALIAGRWFRGIDLRRFGSGNLGATNVYRVLGARAAAGVLLFDIAKGAVPVLLFPRLTSGAPSAWWPIVYGVAAIVGHIRPIYLGGKGGGKGVATATGVFVALAPMPMVLAIGVWTTVIILTRYVSLASVAAASALPFAVLIWNGPGDPRVLGAVAVSAFVIWTHRANIFRLRRGIEPRIGRPRA